MPEVTDTQLEVKPEARIARDESDCRSGRAGCTVATWRFVGWSAVMLRGELDLRASCEVRAAVDEELADSRPVIVELVGLEFSDPQGLRVLGDLGRQAESCRGTGSVEIHGARGQVARLAQMIGLGDVLPSEQAPVQ
jgi:anti-anti-sigma factor